MKQRGRKGEVWEDRGVGEGDERGYSSCVEEGGVVEPVNW